jgi:hypothetical protein
MIANRFFGDVFAEFPAISDRDKQTSTKSAFNFVGSSPYGVKSFDLLSS